MTVQAGLCRNCPETPEDLFSRITAHIIMQLAVNSIDCFLSLMEHNESVCYEYFQSLLHSFVIAKIRKPDFENTKAKTPSVVK